MSDRIKRLPQSAAEWQAKYGEREVYERIVSAGVEPHIFQLDLICETINQLLDLLSSLHGSDGVSFTEAAEGDIESLRLRLSRLDERLSALDGSAPGVMTFNDSRVRGIIETVLVERDLGKRVEAVVSDEQLDEIVERVVKRLSASAKRGSRK